MNNPTDTNQVSEDGLRDLVIKSMRYANSLTPYKLNEPVDHFVDRAIDLTVDEIKSLIRTEKLKLLAEVKVLVKAGGYEASYEISMIEKLEAGL